MRILNPALPAALAAVREPWATRGEKPAMTEQDTAARLTLRQALRRIGQANKDPMLGNERA